MILFAITFDTSLTTGNCNRPPRRSQSGSVSRQSDPLRPRRLHLPRRGSLGRRLPVRRSPPPLRRLAASRPADPSRPAGADAFRRRGQPHVHRGRPPQNRRRSRPTPFRAIEHPSSRDPRRFPVPPTLNDRAERLADYVAANAAAMRVAVHTTAAGARTLDCGIQTPGGLQAGLNLARSAWPGSPRFRSCPVTSPASRCRASSSARCPGRGMHRVAVRRLAGECRQVLRHGLRADAGRLRQGRIFADIAHREKPPRRSRRPGDAEAADEAVIDTSRSRSISTRRS